VSNGSGGGVNNGTGGASNGTGGGVNNGTGGGANGTGGGANGTGGGANGTGGGANGTGGGANGTGGGANGTGGEAGDPTLDANNQGIAAPGDMTAENQAYLRIGPTGEIRILNNNWGSEDLGCSGSTFSVFYNQDKTFGWTFNRPACGGNNEHPDFPQIEFGIHPFGVGNELATSPEFSSTALMPKQINQISTASVHVQGLEIALTNPSKWNITFEFWLSDVDPRLPTADGRAHNAYAELMTFWGWEANRWPDNPDSNNTPVLDHAGPDTVNGGNNYKLWVQRDNWANGWRYFQFRTNSSATSFTGDINVKELLTYLQTHMGYADTLWVTRLEVGSEIDDNTAGTVTLDSITFEVNGESRSAGVGF
jgi:hypothetical protein